MFMVYAVFVLLYIAFGKKVPGILLCHVLFCIVLVITVLKNNEKKIQRATTKTVHRLENEIDELTWRELN